MDRWPPDFMGTIRAHRYDLEGWVVAASGDCLGVQRWEVEHIDRRLEAVHERTLRPGHVPTSPSWLVGVLVCPGDGLDALAAWAKAIPADDLRRVRLYFLPGADPVKALAAWYAEGLPDPATADVADRAHFHKRFGLDLNNQIYLDHRLG